MGRRRKGETYLCTAAGSSNDPGTVCTTMFPSATPHSNSFALAPCTSGSMMLWFHRAWTMATRSGEPSYFCGAGPLADIFLFFLGFGFACRGWAAACSDVVGWTRAGRKRGRFARRCFFLSIGGGGGITEDGREGR